MYKIPKEQFKMEKMTKIAEQFILLFRSSFLQFEAPTTFGDVSYN